MGKGGSGKEVGWWRDRAEDSKLTISFCFVLLITVMLAGTAVTFGKASGQESIPAMPPDNDLIYVLDDKGQLANIPFETATTPLNRATNAKGNRNNFVELRGERSTMNLKTVDPRFYLFVSEGP